MLLIAHRKWFKLETIKAKVNLKNTVKSFAKITTTLAGMEAHRKRSMLVGYYLTHVAETWEYEDERLASYKCMDLLHHGFTRGKLRHAHKQSGLGSLLKIEFKDCN